MDKKTVVITVRVSPETRQRAERLAAATGPGNISRWVRALIDDALRKTDAGERIAEPLELLTVRQRRLLDSLDQQLSGK